VHLKHCVCILCLTEQILCLIITWNTIGIFTKNVNKDSLLVSYESKNVNCIDKYDRDDDDNVCMLLNDDVGTNKACVIGFDFF